MSADSDTLAFKFYLFLTVLDLHCCMQAFLSCEQGLLSRVVHGLPIVEHRL